VAYRKHTGPLPALDSAQRYTLGEAAAYLRMCTVSVHRRIKAGEIRAIKHGRKVYVPGSEIARLSA
jgi:excisionase family DNA binding protein